MAAALLVPSAAEASSVPSDLADDSWQPNGSVLDVQPSLDGTKVYIGGTFDYVGPTTGSSVRLDPTDGSQTGAWPNFSGGDVNAIVPDGSGGWYVGGSFTKVDGNARAGLVHVLSTGLLDAFWNAGTGFDGGAINALAVDASHVFVGGSFASFNGTPIAPNLVALDRSSGGLSAGWSTTGMGATVNVVNDLATSGGMLYVAGEFTNYPGAPNSSGLVQVDAATGIATAWPVNASGATGGSVADIEVAGSTLYLGGAFSSVGGSGHQRLASIDLGDGSVTSWGNPSAITGTVRSIVVTASTVYVGATAQGAVFAADRTTGSVSQFGPSLGTGSSITELAVRGGELLVGGDFTGTRRRFTSLNLADGSAGASVATFGAPPRAIAADGTDVIVGGTFSSATGIARANAAAIVYATGKPSAWNPTVPPVGAIAEAGSRVYVAPVAGGLLFATFASTGLVDVSFTPVSLTGAVNDMAVLPDGGVLVGGAFTSPHAHIAKFQTNGFLDTSSWQQPIDLDVKAIKVVGSTVYLGGMFSTAGGAARSRVARLDLTGVADATWIPPTISGAYVDTLDVSGTSVYIGGLFTSVGGQPRQHVAALSATDGSLGTSWAPTPGTMVRAVAVAGTDVLVGGPFTTIAPPLTSRTYLAAVDSTTGAVDTSWDPTLPRPGTMVQSIATSGTRVVVGTTAGIAIYDQSSLDTRAPALSIDRVDDDAGATDGVYVLGTHVYVRSTNPTPPTFVVHANAHDSVGSATGSYAGVSGLAKVTWPSVAAAAGTWTPTAGSVAGRSRGLALSCFNGTDPTAPVAAGGAIDRAIDYGSTNLPDQLPHLPASLATGGVGTPGVSQDVDDISCRWTGYLLGFGDVPGTYAVRAVDGDGFRANIGGVGANPAPWPTINDWSAPNATGSVNIDFDADQARPITADWFTATGPARAELSWDPPGVLSTATIPEGAFVTDVDYARRYTFVGGSPTDGTSSTLAVSATDRVGLGASAGLQLTIDNSPPTASSFSSTPSPSAWSNATNVSLTISDGADTGSGILDRVLERQLRTIDPATHTCGAITASWQHVVTWTGTTVRNYDDIPTLPANGACVEYRYTSRDNVDNPRVETYGPIRIDTAVPTGGSVTTTPGPTKLSTATVSVTLPDDAESGVDAASSALQRYLAPYTNGACGTFTFASVVTSNPGASVVDSGLPDGSCVQYVLTTVDLANNPRVVSGTDEVMVDRTPPSGNLTSPAAPQSEVPMITGGVTDSASGIASYSVTYSGPQSGNVCIDSPAPSAFSCTWDVSALPSGTYTLSLTATDAAGNTSAPTTAVVQVDTDLPSMSPTVTGVGSTVYLTPATSPQQVWVRGSVSGSFGVQTNATDASSGVASVSYPGGGTGWSPSTATIGVTSPWSQSYAWTANASSPGTMSFVATDVAGNAATSLLDVESDTQPPSGGTISYPSGVNSVATITLGMPTDPGGSGVASTQVERRSATATTPTTCGSFGAWAPIGSPNPPLTWTDTSVAQAMCYEYRLVATDNVGQGASFTNPAAPFITATPGLLVTAVSGTSATEGGSSLTYVVSLRAAPAVGKTVTVTPSGDGQVSAAGTPLTFDSGNWNSPRTVSVSAVDDFHDEPSPMAASVTFAISGDDPGYVGMASSIEAVNVVDDDVAKVLVTAASPLALDESNPAGATFHVALASQPYGAVTVTSTPTAGQVTASPSVLTFDATNWSTSQDVTVVAVDDHDVEGAHSATVGLGVGASNANDTAFTLLAAGSIAVTIADNDIAGLDVVSAPGAVVDEASPSTTTPVRVRLRARPVVDVTVAATAVAGQLVATPAALTFTSANWDQYQAISVGAAPDTVAEPSPSAAQLSLQASSTSPGFGAIPPVVVGIGVKDDDPAAFSLTAGAGWTTSDAGRLQLAETNEPTATARIRAVGDPSADITITPVLSPAGQLEITPRSAVIPAGSHAHVVTFTVRAIDDHVAENDPHPGHIGWKVATTDPLYGASAISATDIEIADGAPAATQHDDTPKETTPDPTPTTTQPPAEQQPAVTTPPATPAPVDPAPGTTVGDEHATNPDDGTDSGSSSDDGSTQDGESSSSGGGAVASVHRTATRVQHWASHHKVGASVAASVGGSAVVWAATAAKPLLLASKVLGGGGMPGPGHGLGQLRHLLKLRKKKREKWLRRLRKLRGDDDDVVDDLDWDDELDWWDDHRAA
jgi:hypothetical protein